MPVSILLVKESFHSNVMMYLSAENAGVGIKNKELQFDTSIVHVLLDESKEQVQFKLFSNEDINGLVGYIIAKNGAPFCSPNNNPPKCT